MSLRTQIIIFLVRADSRRNSPFKHFFSRNVFLEVVVRRGRIEGTVVLGPVYEWRWAVRQVGPMTSATDWMWSITLMDFLNFWISFNASLPSTRPCYPIILPPSAWSSMYLLKRTIFKENLGSEHIHWERVLWVPFCFVSEAGEDAAWVGRKE